MDIDTSRLRTGLPQVGVQPYRQVHAHSTGNRNSTAQNEADYHYRKDPELGFFSHVVGNGRVMQVGLVNNGSWDVGGGWNAETYAAVELIESHSTKEEFMTDYRL
ncbi:peptidoglycan recognition protein family protein, partial [Streptococcus pneumoniae]